MLGILLLSAAVYFPALSGSPILDDRMISSGAAIGGGSFVDCFTKPFLFHYFRPLVSASFWLEMKWHGANPFLLHQTNILFHVLTTYLVVKLAETCGLNRKAALLGGLFFAIQPAQVGAVAWIGGRTDSQACLFFVVMLLAIAKFYTDKKWWWVPLGVLAGFFAMLTKEQVLPAVILAPLGGWAFAASKRRMAWSSAPYLASGLLFLGLWLWGSEPVKGATVPLGEVATQVCRTAVDYGLLFVAPNPWSMHAYTLENFRGPLWMGLGVLICLAIPLGIGQLWRFDRRLGWLGIAGALVYFPVSNIIPIPSLLAAPYRVALSGPVVAILLGLAVSRIKLHPAPGIVALIGAAASLFLTPWGAARHANELTLIGACVRFDPECYYMRSNYVITLQGNDQLDEAMRQSTILLDKLFEGHDWHDYSRVKEVFDTDPAIKQRILDTHGSRAEAGPLASRYLASYGQLMVKMDKEAEAEKVLRAAIELDRENDSAYFGLGQITIKTNPADGVYCLRQAIALNPDNGGAIYALGRYYIDRNDDANAYRTLRATLHVAYDTGEPLMDFAEVALRLGHKDEAQKALALASRRIVDHTRLLDLMGKAYR